MASGAGVLIFVPQVGREVMHNFYAQFLCNLMLSSDLMDLPHESRGTSPPFTYMNFQVSTSFFSTYFSQLHLPKTTNLPLRDIYPFPYPST